MNNICLVACYFGSWPRHRNILFKTFRLNSHVDFLIFSDCARPSDLPSNVELVSTTLSELRGRIRNRLGVEPAIERPYHLCDFKPAYGVIFEKELGSYDWWGCTDLDLIYGDIGRFVTDEMLASADVISARQWYLTGFFFLFRNIDPVNRLYAGSDDCRRVFETPRHFSFGECNFAWRELREGASIFTANTDIVSMTEVIRREEQLGRLNVCFREMARESIADDWIVWENGRLFEGAQEHMVLHFVVTKDKWYFALPGWKNVPNRFYVSRSGFFRQRRDGTLSRLRAMEKRRIAQKAGRQLAKKASGTAGRVVPKVVSFFSD